MRRREQAERLGGGPAVAVPVHDRVDGKHERAGDRDRVRRRRAAPRSPGRGRPGRRTTQSAKTAMPTGMLTRKIQCQVRRSVRIPPRSTPTVPPPAATKPKTPIAFARSPGFGEERHDQRKGDCRDDRAAEALDRARADEHALRRREPACERGDREERDTSEEEASGGRRGRRGVLPEAGSLRRSAGRRSRPTRARSARSRDPHGSTAARRSRSSRRARSSDLRDRER